jgi:hypothetical protein
MLSNPDVHMLVRKLIRITGIETDPRDEKGVKPFGGELIALLRDMIGFGFGTSLSVRIGGHL